MEDAKRIYSLLLQSDGLKIREIAQTLELDKLYVAELLFSEECNPLWYQNDDSLWFAKIGALKIEEEDNEIVEQDPLFEIVVNASALDIKQFRELGVSDDALRIVSEISKYRVFTDDQTHELFLRYDDGDKEAYDLLVKGNLRHIVAVARMFLNTGVPFEDIFQEGVIGLLEAIKKFDFQRSRNFTYFAKLGIYRYLDLSLKSLQCQVKIHPRHIYLHRLIRRFCDDYVQREEMEPPFEYFEIEEDVSPDFLRPIFNLPPDLQDVIVSKNDWDDVVDDSFPADKKIMDESVRFDLLRLVHSLPPRMSDILEAFFGLNGKSEESLETIGRRLNLTRERVRQVKEKGVRMIRKSLIPKTKSSSTNDSVKERTTRMGGRQFNSISAGNEKPKSIDLLKKDLLAKEVTLSKDVKRKKSADVIKPTFAKRALKQPNKTYHPLTPDELKALIKQVMVDSKRPMSSSAIAAKIFTLGKSVRSESVEYLLKRMENVGRLGNGKFYLKSHNILSSQDVQLQKRQDTPTNDQNKSGTFINEEEVGLEERIRSFMQDKPFPMTPFEISICLRARVELVAYTLNRMSDVECKKGKFELNGITAKKDIPTLPIGSSDNLSEALFTFYTYKIRHI